MKFAKPLASKSSRGWECRFSGWPGDKDFPGTLNKIRLKWALPDSGMPRINYDKVKIDYAH